MDQVKSIYRFAKQLSERWRGLGEVEGSKRGDSEAYVHVAHWLV